MKPGTLLVSKNSFIFNSCNGDFDSTNQGGLFIVVGESQRPEELIIYNQSSGSESSWSECGLQENFTVLS